MAAVRGKTFTLSCSTEAEHGVNDGGPTTQRPAKESECVKQKTHHTDMMFSRSCQGEARNMQNFSRSTTCKTSLRTELVMNMLLSDFLRNGWVLLLQKQLQDRTTRAAKLKPFSVSPPSSVPTTPLYPITWIAVTTLHCFCDKRRFEVVLFFFVRRTGCEQSYLRRGWLRRGFLKKGCPS